MANSWLRLWHEMPNDPKWRTISRASKQPLALVQAVYLHLLVDASRNVTRGVTSVTNEDLASSLDAEEEQIDAIIAAMQGRVLNGNSLSGWGNRQPAREDHGDRHTGAKSAAQRKREQREREKDQAAEAGSHDMSRNVTTDTDTDTEEKKEQKALVPSGDDTAGYSAEFEACWKIYPARAGGNSKKAAGKAWNARIRSGVSADDLTRAVERYAAELRAKGKIGTEFVKQASTFFGPDEHWKSYATAQLVQFMPGVLREGYFFHPDDNGLPREQRRQLSRETHDPATGYRLDYLKSRGLA